MYPVTRNVPQGPINCPLSFDAVHIGEGRGFDNNRKMGFPAAIVPGMAVVFGAIVYYIEPGRAECLG
tara:strand:+ start:347 stop:547 length:201 start_codon:yes stop_codon:yes gene_type:complete